MSMPETAPVLDLGHAGLRHAKASTNLSGSARPRRMHARRCPNRRLDVERVSGPSAGGVRVQPGPQALGPCAASLGKKSVGVRIPRHAVTSALLGEPLVSR